MDTNKILELMYELNRASYAAYNRGDRARFEKYQHIIKLLEDELSSRI